MWGGVKYAFKYERVRILSLKSSDNHYLCSKLECIHWQLKVSTFLTLDPYITYLLAVLLFHQRQKGMVCGDW
jgi:hypothetical protein